MARRLVVDRPGLGGHGDRRRGGAGLPADRPEADIRGGRALTVHDDAFVDLFERPVLGHVRIRQGLAESRFTAKGLQRFGERASKDGSRQENAVYFLSESGSGGQRRQT